MQEGGGAGHASIKHLSCTVYMHGITHRENYTQKRQIHHNNNYTCVMSWRRVQNYSGNEDTKSRYILGTCNCELDK